MRFAQPMPAISLVLQGVITDILKRHAGGVLGGNRELSGVRIISDASYGNARERHRPQGAPVAACSPWLRAARKGVESDAAAESYGRIRGLRWDSIGHR